MVGRLEEQSSDNKGREKRTERKDGGNTSLRTDPVTHSMSWIGKVVRYEVWCIWCIWVHNSRGSLWYKNEIMMLNFEQAWWAT